VISLRIWHPGRHVWRIRREIGANALNETWISVRRVPPDWGSIFRFTLDLIWLPNESRPGQIELASQHGSITWQERTLTTRIEVRIEGFSIQKRTLIAAALWKAARFHVTEEA
jgi:hypothetical protein